MANLFDIYANTASFDGFVETKPNTNQWSSATVRTGSDTSEIDGFRQGVELISPKDYYTGIVKIHSGYPDHQIPTIDFGQQRIRTDQSQLFKEVSTYNVYSYINRRQSFSSASEIQAFSGSRAIVFTDIDSIKSMNYDGVIEPLVIRRDIPKFAIEQRVLSHVIKGDFAAGNCDLRLSSEHVTNFYDVAKIGSVQFLDSKNYVLGGIGGYVSASYASASFRDDTQHFNGNLYTANFDEGMKSALYRMTSSDDSYLSYNRRSSSTGFYYSEYGIDSIAFGGLANSPLLSSSVKKL